MICEVDELFNEREREHDEECSKGFFEVSETVYVVCGAEDSALPSVVKGVVCCKYMRMGGDIVYIVNCNKFGKSPTFSHDNFSENRDYYVESVSDFIFANEKDALNFVMRIHLKRAADCTK